MKLRLAAVQLAAGPRPDVNLRRAAVMIARARARGARIVCLPENFLFRGPKHLGRRLAERVGAGPVSLFFQGLARRLGVGIVLGSVLEQAPRSARPYSTALAIGPGGKILTAYRKQHLFDVTLPSGKGMRESRALAPGRGLGILSWFGVRTGLAICYDLRFPELFRELARRGCEMAVVGANFTAVTGAAHWETLVRARAIENQMVVVAPAQCGTDPGNRIRTFGHSLIVGPWGEVLARGSAAREQVLVADFDFTRLRRLRRTFPVLKQMA